MSKQVKLDKITVESNGLSPIENKAVVEFTSACHDFQEWCGKTFELGLIESFVFAKLLLDNYSQLIEKNPTLKESAMQGARYIKEQLSINPPDETN